MYTTDQKLYMYYMDTIGHCQGPREDLGTAHLERVKICQSC